MGLETATYLDDLNSSYPDGTLDPRSQGDDHIRLLKAVLQATFPDLAGRIGRIQQKSSNYTLVGNDNFSLIEVTATGVTLSTNVAIGTLGNGYHVWVYANGFDVTFDPNSTETLQDGSSTSITIFNGELAHITAGASRWLVHRLVSATRQVANLTAETTFDNAADYLAFWDNSASTMRKILGSKLREAFIPAGTVQMYAGSSVPTGWLDCDGSEQAVATYPALDAVLGTTYGARTNGAGGAGSTHFRLPNFKGRSPVGIGQGNTAEGGGLGTSRSLGASGGAEGHVLVSGEMPSHTHTISSSGAHSHTADSGNTFMTRSGSGTAMYGSAGLTGTPNVTDTITSDGTHTHTPANTGGGGSHNNMHPFLAVMFIIKAH